VRLLRILEIGALFLVVSMGSATGAVASPVPQPLAKTGTCPSGYSTSGAYCKPNSGARYAVAKTGSCPSGYSTSGDYCLAGQGARFAVPKVGSCPSGYSTSGSYCLKAGD